MNQNDYSFAAGWELPRQPQPVFQTGRRELIFGLLVLLSALCLCNFTVYGGLNLGFALGTWACIVCAFCYLLSVGCKPSGYSCSLLGLSLVIAAGFARSDDGFVKGVMVCFLIVSVNLGFCLMAGKNLYRAASVRSLLDVPGTVFGMGLGKLPAALRGLKQAFRESGSVGQKGGAFLLGLCLCIPVLGIVIPLLISADAAFDGLMSLLPDFKLQELLVTVCLGVPLGIFLYSRCVALGQTQRPAPTEKLGKGIHGITVNTVLVAICVVYVAYLLSQLAYLFGGFAGILPEGYTVAQYARRGFFEMALLCGINLTVMVLSLGLVRRQSSAPLMTKLLCLFLGLVTLFLVATASAKMFLYIGTYGLTRLRVLTQIIMLFMAVTTVILSVWLFVPKLPYMKAVILAAMLIGAATLWADVNTQVARYNVDAYLSGQLETVDFSHLLGLGDSAIPQLARLRDQAPDEQIQKRAGKLLNDMEASPAEDFRDWNYVNQNANRYLPGKDEE